MDRDSYLADYDDYGRSPRNGGADRRASDRAPRRDPPRDYADDRRPPRDYADAPRRPQDARPTQQPPEDDYEGDEYDDADGDGR